MTKKRSIIWAVDKKLFSDIVNKSATYKEVLEYFYSKSGIRCDYKTLHARITKDGLDASHIEENKKVFKGIPKPKPLIELLNSNVKYRIPELRSRLVKAGLLENKCYKCGIGPEWCGEKLSLQIDHINGDPYDNVIDNLRILCPNCHSQTQTYGAKNSKIIKDGKMCIKCGNVKSKRSSVCFKCREYTPKTKITWPSNDILISLLKSETRTQVGNKLGVSGTAISNRLKKSGLDDSRFKRKH